MKQIHVWGMAALIAALAVTADARPQKLKPAKSVPSSLSEGLAVVYSSKLGEATLRDAYVSLGIGGEPGAPLSGLAYDTAEGANVLSSQASSKVAARVTGYVRFDAGGDYVLDFKANDGLQVTLGGREIIKADGKRGCESVGPVEVRVPDAGWYEIEALWFQWKGGACLVMEWAPEGGQLAPVPAAAFGH